MDWRRLLADRRVQIGGVAAAALAGGVVLWRRRAAGGGGQGDAPGGSSVPGAGLPVGQGFPNTTGTDVAHWVGEYAAAQQAWLQAQLAQLGAGGGGGGGAIVPGWGWTSRPSVGSLADGQGPIIRGPLVMRPQPAGAGWARR